MKKIFILAAIALSLQLQAQNKAYKGGELYSTSSVLYGKFEMCMQASKASGLLSTFFLYKNGSEQQGAAWEEIDIEIFGKNNALSFQSNIITGTGGATKSEQVHTNATSLADDFHVYTLEWTPDYIAWYLDGVELRKTTGAQVTLCSSAMSYRFNTWISNSVPWVGAFTAGDLPKHQFVDWLSYSSYTKGAGDNGTDFTFSWKDDFTTYNSSRWAKANWTFDGNLVDYDPNNIRTQDGKLILSCTTSGATGFTGSVPAGTCAGPNSSKEHGAVQFDLFMNEKTLYLNNSDVYQITIVDLSGKKVFSGRVNNSVFIGELPAGIYIVNINTAEGSFNKKIVLN